MATETRISQLPIEVLRGGPTPPPAVRLAQLPIEVLHSATPEVVVREQVQTCVILPC